ncbi:S8 family serine peptidase [Actinoplanes rectilineatus]|uniref:S8 family serine peptidase n=1 Tax=Actinoplanes rectilineatus TaxID=113571 RepID=UPI000AAB1F4F|nr:S8 family serine peptidase [Actinoplanes rectilineatus]
MTLSSPGRSVPVLLAAVTALAMLPPGPAAATEPAAVAEEQAAAAKVRAAAATGQTAAVKEQTITLITGDKVTVRPGGTTVQGPDGEQIGARITTIGPDTYVYPESALPYVGTGLLDKRLFNITLLTRDGYTDRLPVILGYENATLAKRSGALPDAATEVRALPSIHGRAVNTDRSRAGDFWTSLTGTAPATATAKAKATTGATFTNGITKVWLDGKVHTTLADSVAQIGAPEVWAGGNTGDGVDVAVLDTGIDPEHPDFAGQIESAVSFVPGEEVADGNGHGTHVASTIAGTGAAAGGVEKGVAPGADLQIGKVLDNSGSGQDSWIVAGMEWAARDRKAKVVSMSLGGDPTDGTDPMSVAVNELSAETGALFVIAAGNSGPFEQTVGSPGAADAALTVGAVDGDDELASFSSRGPRVADGGLKPEITAPGVDIVAAASHYTGMGDDKYRTMSGTSMATPHVAGAAALLAAQHPAWTGTQLKDALVSTAKETPDYDAYTGGSGRLDVAATTKATVFASASAYLGIHPLEDEPTGSTEKPITYTNLGAADVTLALKIDAPGVPEDLVSLSSPSVTVPAGGTTTVTLSADLDGLAAKGRWTGSVVATNAAGTRLADTIIGISTENSPKHLVIAPTDRSGKPMPADINLIREGDEPGTYYNIVTLDGSPVDLLLPEGKYSVWTWGAVEGSHGPNSRGMALLTEPDLVVDGNTTLEMTASTTREIQAITPKPSATAELRLDYHRELGDSASATDSYLLPRYYDSIWTTPGVTADDGDMSITARWRKIQPTLAVDDFDDLLVLPGTTLPAEGTRRIEAVFAGTGTAAELAAAKAKNKIAVVRQNDLDEQVAAAEAAGVALLLVVTSETGRWEDATSRTPLAAAALTKDGGEKLITRLGKGRVTLTVTAHPTTDYLYDLVRYWPSGVPKSLVYRPAERDLARVDVDFQNTSDRALQERRYDTNPDTTFKVGTTLPMLADRFRTDWLTPGDDIRWSAEMNDMQTSQRSGSTTYRAGSRTSEKWLAAIVRPRITDAGTLPRRDGDRIVVEVPGWGDSGANHAGDTVPEGGGQTVTLSQGDTVIENNGWGWIDSNRNLNPARLPYRLSTTTTGTLPTRTDWDFMSGEGTARLPLIQLDYLVDTDLADKASRTAGITVVPSHLAGAPSSSTITTVTLDVSYDDGAHWTKVKLTRTKAGWTGGLRAPRSAQTVTLRTAAKDTGGNRVEQTITRAFGLK